MKIRDIAIAAVMAVALSTTGFAQRNGGRAAERQVEQLKEQLKLSEDQQKEVRKILTDTAAKTRELREKQGEGDSAREQLRKIREDNEAALAKVLDKEQMEKYKEIASQRREGMRKKKQ